MTTVADQLKAYYLAGDTTNANALMTQYGITSGAAQDFYGIPDANLQKIRDQGFVFANDNAAHGTNPPPGGGSGMGSGTTTIQLQLPPMSTGSGPAPTGAFHVTPLMLAVGAVVLVLVLRK